MSLIIKGMELPENDGMKELVIGRAPNGTKPIAIVSGDITEFYKIIEIPTPHGRLIDADAHIKLLKENHCGERCRRNHDCFTCGIDMYIRIVENEATIIEAEVNK